MSGGHGTSGASSQRTGMVLGYALALVVAATAYGIHYLPFPPFRVDGDSGARYPISAALLAIGLGMLVCNTVALPQSIRAGSKHAAKRLIPIVIVLMGSGVNLRALASVGVSALLIAAVCLTAGIFAGYLAGKWCGLRRETALLLGAGTGICGNSAVMAVAPLIEADEEDIVLAICAVNLFGVLAMIALPMVAGLSGLSQHASGIWVGSSIHGVPQAVAAGFALGDDAGKLATLVKLVRVTLLAPVVVGFAIMAARGQSAGDGARRRVQYGRLVPWFVWAFAGLAILNTLGLLSAELSTGTPIGAMLETSGKYLLTMAMAAIGLEVRIRPLLGVGGKLMVAGTLSTVALAMIGLGLILLLV